MNAVYLAAAVISVAAIAGAVYLMANGHPWLGALVLLAGGVSITRSEKKP